MNWTVVAAAAAAVLCVALGRRRDRRVAVRAADLLCVLLSLQRRLERLERRARQASLADRSAPARRSPRPVVLPGDDWTEEEAL